LSFCTSLQALANKVKIPIFFLWEIQNDENLNEFIKQVKELFVFLSSISAN
jgi:hypothetical protein